MAILGQSYTYGLQDTLILDQSSKSADKTDLRNFIRIFQDSTGDKRFEEIYSKVNFEHYNKLPTGEIKSNTVWTKLNVRNTGNDTLHLVFFLGYYTIKEMHLSAGSILSLTPMSKPVESFDYKDQFSASLHILPQHTATYWIKSAPFLFFRDLHPYLFSTTG